MKNLLMLTLTLLAFTIVGCQNRASQKTDVIRLHPDNPNYFIYQGKPTILITSGEHYGAIMNTDFDYPKYLQALKDAGFNYTRIFTGPYSEMGDKTFGISNNTMNPKPESWLTPWVKDPSGRYDLDQWNSIFFERLKSFVAKAAEYGIVVEVTLFTSYYTDHQWSTSPFSPNNNLQQPDSIPFRQVNTVNNGYYTKYQENYIRKVVQELNSFGNLFFEIQNEPWADNPKLIEKIAETDTVTHPFAWQKVVETAKDESLEWQKHMAQIITEEEKQLPNKHLIAQNISNFRYPINTPDQNISIFNFHYAYPEAASANLGLQKVIGLDETGFMPKVDFHYRSQAWKFILAGGALYNNLDYSFTVGHEDGSYPIDEGTPGWGQAGFRNQLKILKSFIESFDFIRMKPNNSILKLTSGQLKDFQVLAEPGKQYAIYLENLNQAELELKVPVGKYKIEWIDIQTGITNRTESKNTTDGKLFIHCSDSQKDMAIRIFCQ